MFNGWTQNVLDNSKHGERIEGSSTWESYCKQRLQSYSDISIQVPRRKDGASIEDKHPGAFFDLAWVIQGWFKSN